MWKIIPYLQYGNVIWSKSLWMLAETHDFLKLHWKLYITCNDMFLIIALTLYCFNCLLKYTIWHSSRNFTMIPLLTRSSFRHQSHFLKCHLNNIKSLTKSHHCLSSLIPETHHPLCMDAEVKVDWMWAVTRRVYCFVSSI